MKQQTAKLYRVAVVLLTLAAWFSISNHCVLASLVAKPTAAPAGHEHCPASDNPADNDKPNDCDGLNCCKSLSAPAAFAKKLVSYDKAFYTMKDYVVSEFAFASEQHDALISELDTGPPRAHGFAESVLQRSLLAHAPPLLS